MEVNQPFPRSSIRYMLLMYLSTILDSCFLAKELACGCQEYNTVGIPVLNLDINAFVSAESRT